MCEPTAFISCRLRQLANERDKLLRAYYADAIDVETLKREQARINAEVAEAEAQLATDGERLKQTKEVIDLALQLAKNCAGTYRKARAEVRRMWNRAFFREILRGGRQDRSIRIRGAVRVAARFTQRPNCGGEGTVFEPRPSTSKSY